MPSIHHCRHDPTADLRGGAGRAAARSHHLSGGSADRADLTCWFYPTHDGTFLSWERGLRLSLEPGSIADCPEELAAAPYERSRLSVLWSLLGDDASLTCVGLTYGGQRLDWPLRSISPEPMATWGRFCVDSQADHSLVVEDCLTLFVASSTES